MRVHFPSAWIFTTNKTQANHLATMPSLPIDAVLPELLACLNQGNEAVLQAPPGAGKTTRVPLALLTAEWLGEQKILMLEPRRLAARAAAEYMASTLGKPVGQTVGYRVRLDSKVGPQTRIEVVTEGILTRMLQDDPALAGVGLVIFDEFHERSLDADLGLALTLQARTLFRENPPLKLLVMSATLDGANVAALLGNAPIVHSAGRLHPVDIRYGAPWRARENNLSRVLTTVREALQKETGSLLVFLPGQGEIRRMADMLEPVLKDFPDAHLAPLYGDLGLDEQRRAIAPASAGRRKVVLATDIAETSLTIEGVRVVIDAGLARQPRFDPATGMTRLQTRRLSRASSTQRMGRAGRLEPGVCYRLWSEDQQQQLVPFTPPEILQADLAPLALQLLRWGVDDPLELAWLDPPPAAAWQQACDLLQRLGACETTDKGGKRLTHHGEAMARLPTHPRLGHILLKGQHYGLAPLACDLAALLSERDPLRAPHADIAARLALMTDKESRNARSSVIRRLHQQARNFANLLHAAPESPVDDPDQPHWIGFLLALAYPDRIGRRREAGGTTWQLSGGRAARLRDDDPLRSSEWLAVAQLGGTEGQATDQIFLAAELDPLLFDGPLRDLITGQDAVRWDEADERFTAERQLRIGQLVLSRKPLADVPPEARRGVLLELVRKRGLELLPWDKALRQWQARVTLLRELEPDQGWPDVSDPALLANLADWLGLYLDDVSHINHFARLDLRGSLVALLPWPLPQRLEELAPEKIEVPSGSRLAIDYTQNPPVLAVKLQEMFGCTDTPRIAGGRIPLKLHLLSPARRPLQVTQDLAGFWKNAYREVKKEMKGRYPKHPWPDDPLQALPTRHTKRRR